MPNLKYLRRKNVRRSPTPDKGLITHETPSLSLEHMEIIHVPKSKKEELRKEEPHYISTSDVSDAQNRVKSVQKLPLPLRPFYVSSGTTTAKAENQQ